MGIRKFKADQVFTGRGFLGPDAVLITDESGSIKGTVNYNDAGENVEIFEGMISPGFVNTHCHSELSHMKGRIPPGTGLIEFLTRVIKERNFLPEDISKATHSAEEEMYQSGIVAVGDICNTADSMQMKQNSKIDWFNFLEVIGFNGKDAKARIDYATKFLNEFDKQEPNREASSISPHAPYSVSEELFQMINEASFGKIITIHNQESEAENQLYLNKSGQLFELYKNLGIDARSFQASGKTSLQTYLPWLNKASNIILVHNTFTNEEDIQFIEDKDLAGVVYFCVCINANRYIQSVDPPINLFRDHSFSITLGTDSYASNNQLNILEEIKTVHRQFPGVPLLEVLQWATLNGAMALGMDDKLGSIEHGKQPGLVLISNIIDKHVSESSTAKRLI